MITAIAPIIDDVCKRDRGSRQTQKAGDLTERTLLYGFHKVESGGKWSFHTDSPRNIPTVSLFPFAPRDRLSNDNSRARESNHDLPVVIPESHSSLVVLVY